MVLDLRRAVAGTRVETQQQHAASLEHTQALTNEVARLSAAAEQTVVARQAQQGQLHELQDQLEDLREDQTATLRQAASTQRKHVKAAAEEALASVREELGVAAAEARARHQEEVKVRQSPPTPSSLSFTAPAVPHLTLPVHASASTPPPHPSPLFPSLTLSPQNLHTNS